MIPRIIHYCWFGGGQKPELVLKCIGSWKKICPDYKIIEWNESNYDVNKCAYIREAYENKKWAFVTDYARLDIVYHEGGIYLDTDVEILRSFDGFLEHRAYFGFEDGGFVATGLGFGGEEGNEILAGMLKDYENIHFILEDGKMDVTPCPVRNSHVLEEHGFFLDGCTQEQNGVALYSTEWFCPISYNTHEKMFTENTASIHYYSGLWMEPEEHKIIEIERNLKKIIGVKASFWIRCRLLNIMKLKKILIKQ